MAPAYAGPMSLRHTVSVVAVLNLAFFFVEFTFGRILQSVALLGDSIDFLEDAAVNLLILLALGWSLSARIRASYVLAGLLLIPGISFLWVAFGKLANPTVPEGLGMSVVGLAALAVNLSCAFLVARHRSEEGGIVQAAFLSARNDAIANVLIIAAGVLTVFVLSPIPDLVVGLAIFVMNLDAAITVVKAARRELPHQA